MKDYPAVMQLWNDADLSCRCEGRDSRKNIQWQLKQPCTIYLVATDHKTIIGTVFGTHDARKGWINRLAVSPNYRKKGIATLLVGELEHRFSVLGIDIVACLIEDWNTVSMEVFEKLGYEKHSDIVYFSKRKNQDI
jgi:N-acetylglutamate synthase